MQRAANPQNRSDEELAMRDLVVPELRKRWPGARIVHELPLRYSERRIDLAAICEDKIVSVEIKSSKDVADRLEAQLRAFKPVSSLVVAALAPKWNPKLPMRELEPGRAWTQQFTPCQEVIRGVGGIEVWTVDAGAGAITRTERGYSENDTPWLAEMLDMLWVSELKAIAGAHQVCMSKRPTHHDLKRECADLMTGREIKRAVCRALRRRPAFGAGSDPPIEATPSIQCASPPSQQI